MLIYLDAGHGGTDPGAVKYEKEAELTIEVVKYAADYLKKYYICDVYRDISADSLNTITARANKKKADLFISVHFNAGGGDGYEALVYDSGRKRLGQIFEKYVKSVGQNSRGVKYRPDLAVLRDTNMPAVLNEIAFVDNKKDIEDWNDPAELKKMGEALARAAVEYLKLKKKASDKEPAKQTFTKCNFKVQTQVDSLKIRKTPEIPPKPNDNKNVIGTAKRGVYTIVEKTNDNWGLLKSYAEKRNGWVRILPQYVKRI